MVWCKKNNLLHYKIHNEGKRSLAEAARLKRQGLQPGVPDLCIPMPRGAFAGLYVEFKAGKTGKVSEAQRWWLNHLAQEGYAVYVIRTIDEFLSVVGAYMKLGRYNCPVPTQGNWRVFIDDVHIPSIDILP